MDFSNFPPLVFSFITGCDDEVELESRRQFVCTHTHTDAPTNVRTRAQRKKERKKARGDDGEGLIMPCRLLLSQMRLKGG